VLLLRKKDSYHLSQIGNADQTLIWFDMTASDTIEHIGERSVQIRMTGADK
jgi:hypothetical protein